MLGELHTLLAGLYLGSGDHDEVAASAEEALAHPYIQGRTREVLEGHAHAELDGDDGGGLSGTLARRGAG